MQRKEELERDLEEYRFQEQIELVQRLKAIILEEGFACEDIGPLIGTPKKGGRKRSDPRTRSTWIPKTPENVYEQGPVPAWMKAEMEELGLDVNARTDRTLFKKDYLQAVTD